MIDQKTCLICETVFSKPYRYGNKLWEIRQFCSRLCAAKARIRVKPIKDHKPRKRIPVEERFWKHVDKDGPMCHTLGTNCWKWLGATHPMGYGLLGRGGKKNGLVRATHVSWKIHFGTYPIQDQFICHKCDNPPCCNPSHLFLGTAKKNSEDCRDKGRQIIPKPRYGLSNNKGKLTDEQVIEIRDSFSNTSLPPRRYGRVAIKERLATKYGVSLTHIKDILKGKVRNKIAT